MTDAEENRAAFFHAMEVLQPHTEQIAKDGEEILAFSFTVDLDFGGEYEGRFWRTGGVNFQLQIAGQNFQKHTWCLAGAKRLENHRRDIIAWQTQANNPITFRDFNRLLAALSYEPTS